MSLNIVILADGKDAVLGSELPKVLIRLCGRPVLYHVLSMAGELRAKETLVVVGDGAERVMETFRGADVKWILQSEQGGKVHALKVALERIRDLQATVIAMNGCSPLVRAETIRRLDTERRSRRARCAVLTAEFPSPEGYDRIVRGRDNRLSRIVEEVNASSRELKIRECNAGVYAFDTAALLKAIEKVNKDSMGGDCHIIDVVRTFSSHGGAVAVKADDWTECISINSQKDIGIATRLLNQRILNDMMMRGVTIIDPENTYVECEVQVGSGTVIYPFTVIQSDVIIGRNCQVGPFSHLRPGTVLADEAEIGNFTEVKKSIIGARSRAKHLSYIGDAIIGEDVNVGAGTITANYDGVQKHQTVIESGAHIGSGTVLVAPVRVGKGATTGAGCVVTKGKNVLDGSTVVGVPARELRRSKIP